MARIVAGKPPFVGTRDNITIYLLKGRYIIRTKSSLTGKRVKRDPAFAKTMENAGRLKRASGIASSVYKQMPVNERVYKQYRELVGKAMHLLKEGLDIDHVVIVLEATYLPGKGKGSIRCADKSSVKGFVKRVEKWADKWTDKKIDKKINKKVDIRIDNSRHSISIALYKCFEKEHATSRRRNRSVYKALKKEHSASRRNRSIYNSIDKEHIAARRRNRSGGRFQVGIAGLRLFDTRLMQLYRYSKAHTLENAQ